MRSIWLVLVKLLKKVCSKSVGAGRDTMRATSILGLPVPAKQKSMTPIT